MQPKLIIRNLLALGVVTCCLGALSLSAADTKALWKQHCTKCHGEDGKGKTTMGKKLKVKDYTDPKVQEKMKDADMIKITQNGAKKGSRTLMKPYKSVLSEQEIKDLVAYIRKFKKS